MCSECVCGGGSEGTKRINSHPLLPLAVPLEGLFTDAMKSPPPCKDTSMTSSPLALASVYQRRPKAIAVGASSIYLNPLIEAWDSCGVGEGGQAAFDKFFVFNTIIQ